MGNTIAPMKEELTVTAAADGVVDGLCSVEVGDAREMLERLEEMAQDRLDLFYEKIGHDGLDEHLIPIKKVLNKYTYIGVTAEDSHDRWMQEVRDGVKEFSVGPVADGLSSVAIRTIVKMLSSSAGRRQTTEKYAISIDWFGGISRLDYYIFTYTFASTELARKKTSIIACCVVESSANIKGIDPNTLRVIISRAFRGGDVPRFTLTAIYAQLITAINKPTKGLSLTEQDKLALDDWYSLSDQKSQTGGGLDESPDGGYSQGGPQPAEVGVQA